MGELSGSSTDNGTRSRDVPDPVPDQGRGELDRRGPDTGAEDGDDFPDLTQDDALVEPDLDLDSLPDPADGGRGQEQTDTSLGDQDGGRPDGPRAAVDQPTPDERQVITDAKAALAERVENGDTLGGDPAGRTDMWHEQGESRNERGYNSDCALASTAEVLQECGVPASENDVVEYAVANNLCDVDEPVTEDNGGATPEQVSRVLSDHEVANHIESAEPERLAELLEDGHGVVQFVNSDMLWDGELNEDSTVGTDGRPEPDHAVVVTGSIYDSEGRLDGFVINDTGRADGAAVQVDLDRWQECTNMGATIVTDRPTDEERGQRT